MKLKILLFFFIIFVISTNFHIYAQSEKKANEKLIQKVEELEKKVEQLEARIEILEKKLVYEQKQGTISSYSKGDYKKKENWRALQQGMSKYQVKELLGEPGQISKLSYGGEIWYFPSAIGGSVTFKANATVDGWSEP